MSLLDHVPRQAAARQPPALRRIVVWVPDWPIAAAVVDGAVDPDQPCLIHDQRGVLVACAQARRAGVRVGMRRRVAQRLCPAITTLPADPARDARTFEPVIQAAEEVVAHIDVLRPGLLVMPARGPARYLGSEDHVAEALIGAVTEESGVECHVGIADGLLAAILAARAGTIVAPGHTRGFLAPYDVAVLAYASTDRRAAAEVREMADLLHRLGLRSLGDLAALEVAEVAARLGALGVRAHHLARGGDERPPAGQRPEDDVHLYAELDPPADRADRATFTARALAERLSEILLRSGRACARLEVSARTEDGTELSRTWVLDPGATAAEMADRVRWQLDGWLAGRSGRPPSAPLTRLELIARDVSPAAALQGGLWGKTRRGEAQAERAALRIQGLLGVDAVTIPVLQGGRDPRARARQVAWGDEAVPLRSPHAPWPGSLPQPWPATVPASPIPVEVCARGGMTVGVDGRGDLTGRPVLVRRLASESAEQRRQVGVDLPGRWRVASWAGPWPMVERWWEEEGERRAYLQVSVDEGPALLLAVYGGRWQIEGVYD